MKVFVTGATGLVGAHTALALLRAGHQVRLLARNPQAAREYFGMRGFGLSSVIKGDVRNRAAVLEAMAGSDAVFHAAAMVTMNPRKAHEVLANNLPGVKAVLDTACELRIPNIVYVSSLEVLATDGRPIRDESAQLANSTVAYSLSKQQGEAYARSLQQQGKPVQITYPSGVLAPDDPKLSEANRGLATMLGTVPVTSSGMQIVDARDLALAHLWLLERPVLHAHESARYIVGGNFLPWAEMHGALEKVTGRKIVSLRIPGTLLRGMGHAVDFVTAVVPFDTQVSSDTMIVATQWTPADSTRFMTKARFTFRPPEETLTDTIRWLALAGHIAARRAGRLAA